MFTRRACRFVDTEAARYPEFRVPDGRAVRWEGKEQATRYVPCTTQAAPIVALSHPLGDVENSHWRQHGPSVASP